MGGGGISHTFGMVSLGCPKNAVDSELIMGAMVGAGFALRTDPGDCEAIIVNTCGFIEEAKSESIGAILDMAGHKAGGRCKALVVVGCLSQRYGESLLGEMPEVDLAFGVDATEGIPAAVRRLLEEREGGGPDGAMPEAGGAPSPCAGAASGHPEGLGRMDGERVLSTPPGWAWLRVSEGCDNKCSYCAIPSIRGPHVSRPMESVLREAASLAGKGVRELNLVAQDTTRYGLDIYGERMLPRLIRELSSIWGVEWLRLLYCYPDDVGDDLIKELRENGRLCKYIDIPLQHCSAKVLRAMNRRGDAGAYAALVRRLRAEVPGIVVRTTVMTGFPGEGEAEFAELRGFVKDLRFDRLGAFAYSREEGTPAHGLGGRVGKREAMRRKGLIEADQGAIYAEACEARLGLEYDVLIDGVSLDGISYTGRSYAEAPLADGRIAVVSARPLAIGGFAKVRLICREGLDIVGEAVFEPTQ